MYARVLTCLFSAPVTQNLDRVKVGTTDQSVVMIARHHLNRTILVQNWSTLFLPRRIKISSPPAPHAYAEVGPVNGLKYEAILNYFMREILPRTGGADCTSVRLAEPTGT
jgi:hypothetical protein